LDNKGGRFTLDINGRRFSGRGEAKIKPARAVRENGVNQDGTGYGTVQPKLASLELTFDRGVGLVWDEAMMLQSVNATFVEDDAGRTHLYTNANWSGEPEINTKDGEVSGLKIESDRYQAI
jgi:hypothetical protein